MAVQSRDLHRSRDKVHGSAFRSSNADFFVSVPSVGQAISRTLIADLPEFGTLDRRQVAALAGLAPSIRYSGL